MGKLITWLPVTGVNFPQDVMCQNYYRHRPYVVRPHRYCDHFVMMYVRMCLCGYAGWCVGVYTPDRNDLKLCTAYNDFQRFWVQKVGVRTLPPDSTPPGTITQPGRNPPPCYKCLPRPTLRIKVLLLMLFYIKVSYITYYVIKYMIPIILFEY